MFDQPVASSKFKPRLIQKITLWNKFKKKFYHLGALQKNITVNGLENNL